MKQLERKLFILNSLQSEVIKNLELTEYSYNSYVNPLKCIDEPKYPLKKVQQSSISNKSKSPSNFFKSKKPSFS